MPYNEVPKKFKAGTLHSGGPNGPKVTSRPQMLAIMMSEKRKAAAGKKEYQSDSAPMKGLKAAKSK